MFFSRNHYLFSISALVGSFWFWISEMPVLFENFNYPVLKNVALVFVYVCMFSMLYLHWKKGTRTGKSHFTYGLVLQGISFLVNFYGFSMIDMAILSTKYANSLGDAIKGILVGIFGTELFNIIFGSMAIAIIIGLAPTIVGTFIIKICNKNK